MLRRRSPGGLLWSSRRPAPRSQGCEVPRSLGSVGHRAARQVPARKGFKFVIRNKSNEGRRVFQKPPRRRTAEQRKRGTTDKTLIYEQVLARGGDEGQAKAIASAPATAPYFFGLNEIQKTVPALLLCASYGLRTWIGRSEERRVGKECGGEWWCGDYKKK